MFVKKFDIFNRNTMIRTIRSSKHINVLISSHDRSCALWLYICFCCRFQAEILYLTKSLNTVTMTLKCLSIYFANGYSSYSQRGRLRAFHSIFKRLKKTREDSNNFGTNGVLIPQYRLRGLDISGLFTLFL
jgi:hypothetical protein